MNGKGSKPRNNYSPSFREGWERVFKRRGIPESPKKPEYSCVILPGAKYQLHRDGTTTLINPEDTDHL